MSQKYNIVLSGGGARAYAHIGVFKAFEEKNIEFNAISATSAGAVIGAFLCDGFSIDEIIEILSKSTSLVNFNYSIKNGLLSNNKLATLLKKNLRSTYFEKLKYPFFVSATNLNNGKQEVFNSGNIIDAVIASSSIPILYKPVVINEIPYADGGISSNLPVEPFYQSNLKTIGVHVNPMTKFDSDKNIGAQFERLIHLCIIENTIKNSQKVDLLIEPPQLDQFGLFDLKKMNEIIQIGYDHAMICLDQSSML